MKRSLFGLLVFLLVCNVVAQQNNTAVELVNWTSQDCDNTYNPDRLIDRITSWERKDDLTFLTVNFSDNCCPQFDPQIAFVNNQLQINPYGELWGDQCECMCCFSLSFEIAKLPQQEVEVYFRGKNIERSDDPYATVEPSFEMHEGQKINRTNKYGFAEGTWMSFYDNGAVKTMRQYPEPAWGESERPLWSKTFTIAGKLIEHERKDTTEAWFVDGELRIRDIAYRNGDTAVTEFLRKYPNRQIAYRFHRRMYPMVLLSEFDSTYRGKGWQTDYVYEEKFYENGQREYLQTADTNYAWFENGVVHEKTYQSGEQEYNKQGQLVKQTFRWEDKGSGKWAELSRALYAEFDEQSVLRTIHFVRAEVVENGEALAPGNHYYWKWNAERKLIQSPENWDEDLPWVDLKAVVQALANHDLH